MNEFELLFFWHVAKKKATLEQLSRSMGVHFLFLEIQDELLSPLLFAEFSLREYILDSLGVQCERKGERGTRPTPLFIGSINRLLA